MNASPSADESPDFDPLLLRHRRPHPNNNNGVGQNVDGQEGDQVDDPTEKTICSGLEANFITAITNSPTIFKNIFHQYQIGYKQYNRIKFQHDVLAGCTVAVMVIPLGMSYAKLADLPAHYGLYASLVPTAVFPVFATSRQLSVGPAALVSLVLSSGLSAVVRKEGFDDKESDAYLERYTTLAIQCSFLVGLVYLIMGYCRMGFVTQFLSRALISGFTSGAAIIIAVSQVKYIFGYPIPGSSRLQDLVKSLIQNIDQFNWKTFVMGTCGIAIVLGCKKIGHDYPQKPWIQALGPFVVAVSSIALSAGLNLDEKGVPTVLYIPPGLPNVTVDLWTPLSMDLWVVVAAIVAVGFAQAFAISKHFADLHGYELDSSQELLALGMANLMGGVFQSYPVTGCLGQTAVNDSVGAETGVSSCVTAAFVLMVLLFLTPVFEKMPLASLGAIVIAYVVSMFEYQEAIYLFHVHKFDFSVWMVAFLGTCFLGVEYGLAIAVVASLLIVMCEAIYPHTSLLGRLKGTSLYRNVKQFPDLERYDGIVIARINSPMFFANALPLRNKLLKYKRITEQELEQRNAGKVHYILVDLAPVSHIDTTALQVLKDLHTTQKRVGTEICFSNPGIVVMEKLRQSGIVDLVGSEHFFCANIDAVRWCLRQLETQNGGEAMEGLNHSRKSTTATSFDEESPPLES